MSIAKIRDKNLKVFLNKKGEEQFLVPEHIIHLVMAIAGIILLLYIVVKMAGYA